MSAQKYASPRSRIAHSVVFLCAHVLIAASLSAATVEWTGAGGDTDWNNPANWTGSASPGPGDDVVVNTTNIISHGSGNTEIASLQCTAPLSLEGGSLSVTAGDSLISGNLTIAPNVMLKVAGTGASLLASGTTAIDGADLQVVGDGAAMTLSGVASYADTSGCCGSSWSANGPGAVLNLPGLTTLTGNPTWAMNIQAQGGAQVLLTNVTTIPGSALAVVVDGAGSVVDFSALATNQAGLNIEARNGGRVQLPQLVDGRGLTLTMDASSAIDTDQFLQLGNVTLHGAALILPAVTNMDGAHLQLDGGATLTAPLLESYADTSGCCGASWNATGEGSVLNFPALTRLEGNPTWAMSVQAHGGGQVLLTNVTTVPGALISVLASGSNSVVDLVNLVTNHGRLWLEANSEGDINLPLLVDGAGVSLTLRANGTIDTDQFEQLGSVTLDGYALTLPVVTNMDGAYFQLNNASTLTLPALATYADTSGCCGSSWEANGTDSLLNFPALTNLVGNPTWAMSIRAVGGGQVVLSNLVSAFGRVSIESREVDSVMDLTALLTLDSATLTARNAGSVRVPILTTFTSSTAVADNALLDLSSVENASNTTVQESNGGHVELDPQVQTITVTWTGDGGDNSWHNPTNWSTGVLPGPFNSVSITLADAEVEFSQDAPPIRALTTSRPLTISGGTLSVSNSVTLNSTELILSGGDLDFVGTSVLNSGTAQLDAGNITGTLRLVGGSVDFGTNSTASGTLALRGATTASATIPSNIVLRVEGSIPHGPATLTLPQTTTNHGTIVLETVSNGGFDQSSYLTISTGVLVNASSGLIQINRGAGERRVITGDLENRGTIAVETNTLLEIEGKGHRFVQMDGLVQADGELRSKEGSFEFEGGALEGLVRAQNAYINVADTVSSTSTLRAVGPSGLLGGNLGPDVTVWIEGHTSFGVARLTVTNDTANLGRILMENTHNGGFDQSCFLEVAEGATLEIGPNGLLEAQAGEGENRIVRGHLRNRGRIVVGPGEEVDFVGTLDAAGGTYEGLFYVRSSDVLVTAEPASPTMLQLVGGNTLLSDNQAGMTLWVQGSIPHGPATLTLPQTTTNYGTIVLETVSNGGFDQSSFLTISTGALVNATSGLIQANLGQGERRVITGNLENWGTLNVQSNQLLELQGDGHRFLQMGGVVQADGEVRSVGGSFEFHGGTLEGLARAQNAYINVADTVTSTSTLRAVGPSGLLGGNLGSNVTVWIEGHTSFGVARLTVTNDTANLGRILMENTHNGGFDQSCFLEVAEGAVLEIGPNGLLEAQPGKGENRIVRGHLRNRGRIVVGPGEEIDFIGTLEAAGGTYEGLFYVRTSDVLVTEQPSTPTTLQLVSANQLLTDNQAGMTLWVQGSGHGGHGPATLTLPQTTTNHGIIRLETISDVGFDQSSFLTISTGALVNAASGLIQVNRGAGEHRFINGVVTNQGTFLVQDITATMQTGPFINDTTGLITGNGTINVSGITFENRGTVSPGASPGQLAFTGNYTQTAAGRLDVELDGLTPISEYDRLAVSGTATLDGTLNVSLGQTFVPAESNSFRVVTYGSVAGQFATYNGLNIFTNLVLEPDYLATALDLVAVETTNVVVVPPSIVSPPADQTIINGQTALFSVTANGTRPFAYQWLFNGDALSGENDFTLTLANAQTNQSGAYQVVITNAGGAVTSAVATLTVRPVADLVILDVTGPTNTVAGQPALLTWRALNQGSQSALAPWVETVSLSTNLTGTPDIPVTSFTMDTSLPANQSGVRTQSVITPGGLDGLYYWVIRADTTDQVVEEANETNNTSVALEPVLVRSPDLQPVEMMLSAAAAEFGGSLAVSWISTNSGSAAALSGWENRLFLGTNETSLVDAIELGTFAFTNTPLADGGAFTNTQTVTLPLESDLTPGDYFILVSEDHGDAVAESVETNNLVATPLTLTRPPLPDLMVLDVMAPAEAQSGQWVTLTWSSTNGGSAPLSGPWSETVYVSPNDLGDGAVELATIDLTNALPVGGTLLRTQSVFLPVSSPLGELWFSVHADSRSEVVEEDEANNLGVAGASTLVPALLTLVVTPAEISEGASQPLLGSVTRNGDRSLPLIVTLSNSDATELFVTNQVIIPTGQASAGFSLVALADGVVDGPRVVQIEAAAEGFQSATAPVTVLDVDVPGLALTLASNSVVEGLTLAGTVNRDAGTNAAVSVVVGTSAPGQLLPPANVEIPAGDFSADFVLVALDDSLIESPLEVSVSVDAAGHTGAQAGVTVLDDDLPLVTLTLAPDRFSEGDGPQAALATLTRDPVSSRALEFDLESSNTNAALLPVSVTIPADEASVTFPVAAVDNDTLDGEKPVTATAWINASGTGSRLAEVAQTPMVVTDDDGPTLTLTVAKDLVTEGLDPATTATVSRNTGTNGALEVTLASGDTNEVILPPAVTIPDGAASVTFDLVTPDDGTTDGSQLVTLTADAPGYTGGSEQITVSDINLPDLVVSSLSAPAAAETEAFANLGYTLLNQGLSPMASNSVVQRILLSTDPVIGDDILLGQFAYMGPLPVSDEVGQTFQVRLPQAAGDYWLVVETDAGDAVAEILEDNNIAIAAAPIRVTSEYEAEVSTSVESAPTGTLIPLTGRAFRPATGGPAPFKLVNIHIVVRGTRRIISALTDASGNFSTSWRPLPGEAGFYDIAAAHPGNPEPATQDTFSLFGMKAVPAEPALTLAEHDSVGGLIQVINSGDLTLTDLRATVQDAPANLDVVATLQTNVVAGLATNFLTYGISARDASVPQGEVRVQITSAEGAVLDIPFDVKVEALVPRLVAQPAELVRGMKRGEQTLVDFDLANFGGVASGPITVSLPAAPWLSLASPNPLPSIEPGGTNTVTLQLMPAEDLTLTLYQGTIALNADGAGLSVPFEFRALSDATGDLRVTSVDEFTYYAEGSPPLTNAMVVVMDALSDTVITNGLTDADGEFFAADLPEGYYDIELTAPDHTAYRNTHLIESGRTNEVLAFLSRQTVKYTWTVEPTEIEDRYTITVESVFEANVPAPVVTVDPGSIDLSDLTTVGQVRQVNMTIRNHGLIAVEGTRLSFSKHPYYEIQPLIEDLGRLDARASLTVPVTLRRIGDEASTHGEAAVAAAGEGLVRAASHAGCSMSGAVAFHYICGPFEVGGGAPVAVSGVDGDCGAGGIPPVVVGGGPGGTINIVAVASEIDCTPGNPCWPLAIGGCIPGPIGCGIGLGGCGLGLGTGDVEPLEVLDCLVAGANCLFPPAAIPSCVYALLRCTKAGGGPGVGAASGEVSAAQASEDPLGSWESGVHAMVDVMDEWIGDSEPWLNPLADSDTGDWFARFQSAATSASDGERYITEDERADLLTGVQPPGVAVEEVHRFLDRWNRTLDNWAAGIMTRDAAPEGASTDFIDSEVLQQKMELATYYQTLAEQEGYGDPIDALTQTYQALNVAGLATGGSSGSSQAASGTDVHAAGGKGVCARVRLRLDQEAVVSREAFRATLEFENNGTSPLEDISVAVRVTDAAGNDVTDLFGIRDPELTDISDVDGAGVVPVTATATAEWTIIPTVDAAPVAPTQYFVSGQIVHTLNGTFLTVPLAPVGITVHPTPLLTVNYFHERDVFSDDPHTDAVEPSVPFNLAVMVQNNGAGDARNFHITSAQPEIVENEKGLLVDFKIIGTEVAGQNLSPSLTANFGNIASGDTAIARWLLTSTVQGLFIDYNATFEHIDGLGNPRLSLIESVDIHEMNHLVQAGGSFEDGLPDFLVNDVPDLNDFPDTLWLSDGTTNPVSVVTNGAVNGTLSADNLEVELQAALPGGWAYLRVPDPADGQYQLAAVVRSDNVTLGVGTNVWVTDRTFIGQGKRPIRENILHLLDYNSPGSYTLIYAPNPEADFDPPSSAVAALPENSRANIPLTWSGQDNDGGQGIAFYDVYVSENNGAFQRWLWGTIDTAAVYQGTLGRDYAFYSVAVDRAGNREAVPPVPDAVTSVTLTNHAPVLGSLVDTTIEEGDTLLLTVTASDVDEDELTFSLMSGAPSGMVLNPFSGLLRWVTGETHGPSSNHVSVQVLDNGAPRLGQVGSFTVFVTDANSPPTLAPIPPQFVSEEELLMITNVAVDYDMPPQALTYSLGADAPAGAAIDAATGVFSWQPTDTQGGVTNLISIIVTDDGQPPASATQTFAVAVFDTSPDLVLTVGTTQVLAGAESSVPLSLHSGLDITDLKWVIELSSDRLLDAALTELSPVVGSAEFQSLGDNRFSARFTSGGGGRLQGDFTLAELAFTAGTNGHSEVVRIDADGLVGTGSSRVSSIDGIGIHGRVFVLETEPILDVGPTPADGMALVLYGLPGHSYTIEQTATPDDGDSWRFDSTVDVNELRTDLGTRPTEGTLAFFRAVEGAGRALTIHLENGLVVVEWPADCTGCTLEESSSMGDQANWKASSAPVQTNEGVNRVELPPGTSPMFFRLVSP